MTTSRDERARLISEAIEECRQRREHSAFAAEQAALAALPEPVVHWMSTKTPSRPAENLANTSLSSINRGAADLNFGGRPVFMTTGYPFVTPDIGLAHGVFGIGGTVSFSVHTASSVMPDVDEYMDRLDFSLRP